MCEDGRWRFGVWQVASSVSLVIGKLALEAVARLVRWSMFVAPRRGASWGVRFFVVLHHGAAPRGAFVFCSIGG